MPDIARATRQTLMDELTPTIVSAIEANRADILASAGTRLQQVEMRVAWPIALNILPGILAHAYAEILKKFGTMTMSELANHLSADLETMRARQTIHD